jgi:hypothetical protein
MKRAIMSRKEVSTIFVRSDNRAASHHQSYRRTWEVFDFLLWRLGGSRIPFLPCCNARYPILSIVIARSNHRYFLLMLIS